MKNMAGMMKKVQDMQDRLRVMQEDLATMKFTAVVGGDAVRATVTGDGKLVTLKISEEALNPSEAEILEDMICLATNNAHQQAYEEKTRLIRDITGGLPLPPGMSLPF